MTDTTIDARELAGKLLEIGAVVLQPNAPFTWASGLHSPVYCDNRMTLGHPGLRGAIAASFADIASGYAPDRIAGTATAGIPHAAWLADVMNLPMCYVRSKAKGHGKGNQIEGPLDTGDGVVLVEDLVSTGMSSIAAVEALRAAGAGVHAVVAIFSYGLEKSRAAFSEANVPLHTLTTFSDLIASAEASGGMSRVDVQSLRAWHADPVAWSEALEAG
ncbi:MAG: orotate phosphoribosyltransferase [Rhodothermales bacterium]|nr:orotate phosphoribosyltransferase [Rhodothermales bacterium]MBO6779889.1 orotate phosphoribosyltransferase [Rhodothermales bacterium]